MHRRPTWMWQPWSVLSSCGQRSHTATSDHGTYPSQLLSICYIVIQITMGLCTADENRSSGGLVPLRQHRFTRKALTSKLPQDEECKVQVANLEQFSKRNRLNIWPSAVHITLPYQTDHAILWVPGHLVMNSTEEHSRFDMQSGEIAPRFRRSSTPGSQESSITERRIHTLQRSTRVNEPQSKRVPSRYSSTGPA